MEKKLNYELIKPFRPYLFDSSTTIKEPELFVSIDKEKVSSLGNILCVSGPAKTGKTSLVSALIAPSLHKSLEGVEIDTVGLDVHPNPLEHEIVYINTELSDADFDKINRNILRRAGLGVQPSYFHSLNFTGLSPVELNEYTEAFVYNLSRINRIRIIVIDGIADYVSNVNDPTSCNEVVKMLQRLAKQHDAVIVVTIHKNPGDETGKSRGHLGSEIVRKCEAVLNLRRTANGIQISGSDTRNSCPDFVPRYMRFDSEKGYFVTAGTDENIKQNLAFLKLQNQEQKVQNIFNGENVSFTYGELIQRLMPVFEIKEEAAKKKIQALKKQEILNQNEDGKYVLKRK